MKDRTWTAICSVLAAGAVYQVNNLGFELAPERGRELVTLTPRWCAGATAACFALGVAAVALLAAPPG